MQHITNHFCHCRSAYRDNWLLLVPCQLNQYHISIRLYIFIHDGITFAHPLWEKAVIARGKHFFAPWFPKDIQHCVVFPHPVWLLIKMRSLQSSQRRVHLSGSDSSGRVRPSYTDFTLLQHSAQPWDWNRLQLWHPTSYLIYLLQCCSMSHLPLHCYTSSQTHLHTKLWWFMLISAKRLNKKKMKRKRGRLTTPVVHTEGGFTPRVSMSVTHLHGFCIKLCVHNWNDSCAYTIWHVHIRFGFWLTIQKGCKLRLNNGCKHHFAMLTDKNKVITEASKAF